MKTTHTNRRQRKQLARDISKFSGNKISTCLRRFVDPMVTDNKAYYVPFKLLRLLSEQGFAVLKKIAANNKKRRNSVFFEPVVMCDMENGRSTTPTH